MSSQAEPSSRLRSSSCTQGKWARHHAFDRNKINCLNLRSPGMEFATEMVVVATQARIRVAEIPITLRPDGRGRSPHLRSIRDGLRHLKLMLRLRKARFAIYVLMKSLRCREARALRAIANRSDGFAFTQDESANAQSKWILSKAGSKNTSNQEDSSNRCNLYQRSGSSSTSRE